MAKSTRGKKVKPVRKARTPRQPKSSKEDVQLRLELVRTFGYRHDEQSSEALINICSIVYDYIKEGVNHKLNAKAAAPLIEASQPDPNNGEKHFIDPQPEAPTATQKKSHFEEDRILM